MVIESADGLVTIEFERSTACKEGCKGCGVCDSSGRMIQIETRNTLGAQKGDRVVVEMSAHAFRLATLILYVAPLVAFMAALLISFWLGVSELLQGVLALGATALVFLTIRLMENKIKDKSIFTPKIIKVIHDGV